jgi:AAA+ ATPase superfamily predicted ATPase
MYINADWRGIKIMSFIGRKEEFLKLEKLRSKKTASFVCVLGRRRIGKSALIEEWSKKFQNFFEVQGLGPEENTSHLDQLEHFAKELSHKFKVPKPSLSDWDDAFEYLAKITSKGEWLLFLDEISWLSTGDDLFAVKLKSAWDTKFKKNPKLILVVCGSVSTWIENNILNSSHFLGRVSLDINLKELSLLEVSQFWDKNNYHIGPLEKMLTLSITGGVPKYLEEIIKTNTSSKNLAQLCFDTGGILYRDFDKIFKDIFQRRSKNLEKIVRLCLDEKLTPAELAKKLKIDHNSDLTEALHILELSGFISRDYYFKTDTSEVTKASHLRVKDNYTRFYLKIIEPLKQKIEKGGVKISDLAEIKNIDSIMGYQLENLLLANKDLIHQKLEIKSFDVQSSAPHVQKKTSRIKKACSVDLLIHTKLDVFFLCEFKCKKVITQEIIKEIKLKMNALAIPKRCSLKPVLIYSGKIDPNHAPIILDYFYRVIDFDELMKS